MKVLKKAPEVLVLVTSDRFRFKTYIMQLIINGERLISEVQGEFTKTFPYLRIEFFRNGVVRQHRYPAHLKITGNYKLKDAWVWKKDNGSLELRDSMSVLELENAFMDNFGLSVQVFRKSGNIWLETTMTDDWTLKQQSDHGKEISLGPRGLRRPDDNDYYMEIGRASCRERV